MYEAKYDERNCNHHPLEIPSHSVYRLLETVHRSQNKVGSDSDTCDTMRVSKRWLVEERILVALFSNWNEDVPRKKQRIVGPSRSSYGPDPRFRIALARQ